MHELLVLPTEWLSNQDGDIEGFKNFINVINRGYNKPKFKHAVIATERLKNHTSLVSDFDLRPDSNLYIYMLLGPKDVFDILKKESGYSRDFSSPCETLEQSFHCDIPDEYVSLFQVDPKESPLKINVVDKDYKLTTEDANRCLGTLGVKAYKDDKPDSSLVKNVGITAFTSFMRDSASKLLELVIERCLLDPELFLLHSDLPLSSFDKILISADFIKEHKLAGFYANKCGFKPSLTEDEYVEVGPTGKTPFEEDAVALRDFSRCFIEREVQIR